MIRVLHIANAFAVTTVHSSLAKELENLGVEQTVYCPVREEKQLNVNRFDGKHIQFVYSYCIRSWYRFVYHFKAWMLYRDMKQRIDVSQFDLIHAHAMFNDGGLAYKIYKEYGIPYVLAVRSADLGGFIGHRFYHVWPNGWKILLNASKIYFISEAGKKSFENSLFSKPILHKIKDKFEVRPNGIEYLWHDHIVHHVKPSRKICYVGTFLERKNLVRLVAAVRMLKREKGYEDITLRVIGGGNDYKGDTIKRLIDRHPDDIEFLGKIKDKHKLISSMRECALFAMPSWNETFGLVYVEALSQGLPVVYTKNDGIDGFFDESIGIAVDCMSVPEIAGAMKEILDHPGKYGNSKVDFEVFDWRKISQMYLTDYQNLLDKK